MIGVVSKWYSEASLFDRVEARALFSGHYTPQPAVTAQPYPNEVLGKALGKALLMRRGFIGEQEEFGAVRLRSIRGFGILRTGPCCRIIRRCICLH